MKFNIVKVASLMFFTTVVGASIANAGDCKLSIQRTACSPDKEKAMLKPYDGKNPSEETIQIGTEKECVAKGEDAAKIVRKGTIAKKAVTIHFDGKEVGKKEGTAECK